MPQTQLDYIRLQTQLYQAMRAAPADALSETDREVLALLEQPEGGSEA